MMRAAIKQSNRKSSISGRLGTTITGPTLRRTIDVFIIEARSLVGPGGLSKPFNPFIRLKFGSNKKYRTQVDL